MLASFRHVLAAFASSCFLVCLSWAKLELSSNMQVQQPELFIFFHNNASMTQEVGLILKALRPSGSAKARDPELHWMSWTGFFLRSCIPFFSHARSCDVFAGIECGEKEGSIFFFSKASCIFSGECLVLWDSESCGGEKGGGRGRGGLGLCVCPKATCRGGGGGESCLGQSGNFVLWRRRGERHRLLLPTEIREKGNPSIKTTFLLVQASYFSGKVF